MNKKVLRGYLLSILWLNNVYAMDDSDINLMDKATRSSTPPKHNLNEIKEIKQKIKGYQSFSKGLASEIFLQKLRVKQLTEYLRAKGKLKEKETPQYHIGEFYMFDEKDRDDAYKKVYEVYGKKILTVEGIVYVQKQCQRKIKLYNEELKKLTNS